MMLKKRLFIGGLFTGVTKEDLIEKLRRFGEVISVEIKQTTNPDGEVTKTFAFVDINITEDNLPKCIKVYSNTLWKGKEFFIQVAKESFLSRLKREQADRKTKEEESIQSTSTFQNAAVSRVNVKQAQVPKVINNEVPSSKIGIEGDSALKKKRKRTKFDSSSDSDSADEEEPVCKGLPMFKGLQMPDTSKNNDAQNNSNNNHESVLRTLKSASKSEIPFQHKRKMLDSHTSLNNEHQPFGRNRDNFGRNRDSLSPATSILDRLENFSSVWRNDDEDSNNVSFWKNTSKQKEFAPRSTVDKNRDNEETYDLSYKNKSKKLKRNIEDLNNSSKDNFSLAKQKVKQISNETLPLKNKSIHFEEDVFQSKAEINSDTEDAIRKKKKKRKKNYEITNESDEITSAAQKDGRDSPISYDPIDISSSSKRNKKNKKDKKDSNNVSFTNSHFRDGTFQTVSKDIEANSTTEKHEKANRKRIETLKQKQAVLDSRRNAIKIALTTLDSSKAVNKKIKFDLDEDEEDGSEFKMPSSRVELNENDTSVSKKKKQKSKLTLFDDEETDEESSTLPAFETKPQYEGVAGQKLLNLESKFGGDDRFKMDERFLEEFDDEEDVAPESIDENEDVNLKEEKEKNLQLLSSIVGEISPEKATKSFHFKDIQKLRYDPEIAEHEKFEIKSPPTTEAKKKKKPKKEEVAEPLPEVSTERFFEVVPDLKELLNSDSKSFSLLKTFASEIKEEEPADNYEYTEKEIPQDMLSKSNQKNPFKYDSSDNEDAPIEVAPERPSTRRNNPAVKRQNAAFFFVSEDPRLKEGISFFQQKENTKEITFSNWKEIRHHLNKTTIRKGKASIRKRFSQRNKRKINRRF